MNKENTPYTDIILNSIADGVFTVDRRWNITSFNRAAEKILGIPRAEALGKKCFDVFRAGICQTDCALKKSMQSGKELVGLGTNILNRQGTSIPVSVSTAVLRNENGDIIGGAETFRDLSAIEALQKQVQAQYTFQDIIGKNHQIRKIFDILPDIAESDSAVLIEGPSGSGKELIARAIHNLSPRKDRPFIAVNCGALPDTLLESELFGYKKGAFTNAVMDKPGRFARARGGTIFLDEIGDTSAAMQVKLLRVIQEKEYEPLGGAATEKADVRILSATNRDLTERTELGEFRSDLYYRLNVVKIRLPGLAERREDIPLLAAHFITNMNLKKRRCIQGLADAAMAYLMAYDFPGNVRELENIIEHAFVLCRDPLIQTGHLPREIVDRVESAAEKGRPPARAVLSQAEAKLLLNILKKHNGNRTLAAQELGMDKSTLWRKMKKYGITFTKKQAVQA